MKKIILYISDGVGCRNFIYSSFLEQATAFGFEVVILKNTTFDIDSKGCKIVNFPNLPIPPMVDLLKSVKIEAELNYFADKFGNEAYRRYIHKSAPRRLKDKAKKLYKIFLVKLAVSARRIAAVEANMYAAAEVAPITKALKEILAIEKPHAVMFTNQRSITNIPILLAAQQLSIPSITTIFSWDNLPKGTKIHKSDFYFVWSQYMFDEMLKYYPSTDKTTIRITGTPQFSAYNDHSDIVDRAAFFEKYQLASSKQLITFTGDDYVSSPHDEVFLDDACNAVARFNQEVEDRYQVVFRRCPVDRSARYDAVIKKHAGFLTVIDPLWNSGPGGNWQASYPLQEDNVLLKTLMFHSAMVINLGSTIAIDASFFNTPACYVNYQPVPSWWEIKYNYKKLHFDTLKGLEPVFWINDKNEYNNVLKRLAANETADVLSQAHQWAERIILHPIEEVHERMWREITAISAE